VAGVPGRPVTLATLAQVGRSETHSMTFSPDGRTLAVVADSTTVMLWDVADRGRPVLRSTVSGNVVSALAFSPDGRSLAVTGDDTTIALWNVADRSAPVRLATLTGHSARVYVLAFSPDGRTLVSAGDDRTTVLWDVRNSAHPLRLATLNNQQSRVYTAAFSQDSRTLATGDVDREVILWDVTTPTGPIRLSTSKIRRGLADVKFRPDGRTLAVTGDPYDDERPLVTMWNYGKLNNLRADPARHACGVIGRGLTAAEWSRFIPEFAHRPTCTG
jgi:WD40 repeat protein